MISIEVFFIENRVFVCIGDHQGTATIRESFSCILGEFFYLCSLKYPYLLKDSHLSLWQKITGPMNDKAQHQIQSDQRGAVPLLLADSIPLLLRILLTLPYPIPAGSSIIRLR